jgi:hypothetical protein
MRNAAERSFWTFADHLEEAMSSVIDWWGKPPAPMKEAIEQFRVQLGAAIDSVEFVKKALDMPAPETPQREGR